MNFITKYGPILITVAATISAAVFTPAFVGAHPTIFAVLNALAMILHSLLPSTAK